MDNTKKVLNLLGLAKRAGKVITGEELVVKAIQNGKASLVFVAHDVSENLNKKITDKSSYYEVSVLQTFSVNELSVAIGANRKVLAIADDGFAKKMESLMTN
ncbi:YlxQ-related RNA-binding protein [Lactococcus garvieae]|nr:YlxQ-related RNA-binding protein [Lactococcus garvieae]